MKRCFGYVRVSTAKQGEGVSLDAQKEAIDSFAARNDITIAQWFEEKETAAKSGRPIFNGMLRALRKGQAEGVVIHKIDRSARNFGDWAKIGELADAGIDVHFATESLDFRSRGGRLSADIQAVIAADYIRNLREETIKGITGRLKQGLYPFRAPIGYLDNGGGKPKTPDPVRAPLIREMFRLYASGQHSLRSLRAEMEKRGLRNVGGKPLSKCGIETVLGNPFYCGLIRIRRTGATYQGTHEPIVSTSRFETVQEIRAGRWSKRFTRHNYTYRGLFRCKACQTAMTPERQKGHVYYRCHTPECRTKCVREEELERAIEATLLRAKLTDEDIAFLTAEIEGWSEKRAKRNRTNTIDMQLQQVDNRLDRLTDALIDRLIDQADYSERKERLLLERSRLEETAAKRDAEKDDIGNVRKFLELIKSLAITYIFAEPGEKRQITQIATSNRFVAGKNIGIEPADWLAKAEIAIGGLVGPPYRTTSRTRPELQDEQLKALVSLANSYEATKIEAVFSEKHERVKMIG